MAERNSLLAARLGGSSGSSSPSEAGDGFAVDNPGGSSAFKESFDESLVGRAVD